MSELTPQEANQMEIAISQRKRVRRKTQRGKASPNRVRAVERQYDAATLRAAGASFVDIATQLGYKTPAGARAAVIRAMENLKQESAEELARIQYERLNVMLMNLWPSVLNGDPRSIDTALRVMDRMNILKGISSPEDVRALTQINNTTNNAVLVIEGNEEEYIAALRKARGELEAIEVSSVVKNTGSNGDNEVFDAVALDDEDVG